MMIRTTGNYCGGERPRTVVQQRQPAASLVYSPFLPPGGGKMRLINVSVAVPADYDPSNLVTPSPVASMDNGFAALSAAAAYGVIPPPPLTPTTATMTTSSGGGGGRVLAPSPSFPTACSPITVCSDTTWRHTPSPRKQQQSQQSQQQQPFGSFVPITVVDQLHHQDASAVGTSPLSWAMPRGGGGGAATHHHHYHHEWQHDEQSVYRPYGRESAASTTTTPVKSPHTVETCSVTTVGTTPPGAGAIPPPPPLHVVRHHHHRGAAKGGSYPPAVAAGAAVCLPVGVGGNKGRTAAGSPTMLDSDELHQRKIRMKTELCMHYENGRLCPFGNSTLCCLNDVSLVSLVSLLSAHAC